MSYILHITDSKTNAVKGLSCHQPLCLIPWCSLHYCQCYRETSGSGHQKVNLHYCLHLICSFFKNLDFSVVYYCCYAYSTKCNEYSSSANVVQEKTLCVISAGSNGGARDAPVGPNSFIFMQFSAKILQNNPNF